MKTNNKRPIKETIELFKNYAYNFEREAQRCSEKETAANWRGKAEAYRMAAFEIENNMKMI